MNCQLIEEIYALDLPVKKKAVLLAMATLADDEGKVCAPMAYIGWKSDFSEAQARRYVQALERDGLLNPIIKSGGRRPSTYQIQPSHGAQKQPYQGVLPTLATLAQDARVACSQPSHIDATVASDDRVDEPLQIGDRVSDSQPSTIEHGDDRVDRVVPFPPKNPPKEQEIKASNASAASARDNPQIAEIKLLVNRGKKPSDTDVLIYLERFGFDVLTSGLRETSANAKVQNDWNYTISAIEGKIHDAGQKPPTSSAAPSPNGKHAKSYSANNPANSWPSAKPKAS